MRKLVLTLLGCAVQLAACGGGGDPEAGDPEAGDPDPITVVCHVVPAGQGTVREDELVHEHLVDVGDYYIVDQEPSVRGFYRFDLSAIPAGARIQLARLTLSIDHTEGDPFGGMGNLWVQHVETGAGLDRADYGGVIITPAVDHLTAHPGPGPFSFTVTAAVQERVGLGRTTCDFRLEFSRPSDDDDAPTYLRLAWVAGGEETVRLVVAYVP